MLNRETFSKGQFFKWVPRWIPGFKIDEKSPSRLDATVAIIGGGPAGVAAAIWLHKYGISALILEKSLNLGGLQRHASYDNGGKSELRDRSGMDLADSLEKHVLSLGCPVRFGCDIRSIVRRPEEFACLFGEGGEIRSRFVIIATGAKPRSGGFLKSNRVSIGPGVPVDVKGKRVAILGGGDSAFYHAWLAQEAGASVKLFSRHEPRVQTLLRGKIARTSVIVGEFNASQASMTVNRENFDVFEIHYGFEAIIPEISGLDQHGGFIVIDCDGSTNISGLYASGDVTNFLYPCVTTAAALGIQVANTLMARLS